MKKVVFSLIAVAAMALAVVSCNNNKANEENTDTTAVEAVEEAAEAATLAGNWYYSDDTYYTFNEDGTGSYTAGGSEFGKFTYTEADGKLTLAYEGSTDPMVLNYTNDGKTLTILEGESNLGSETAYTRK